MPDHIRQPQNAMGPRSPAGSDSPLSLVISGRSRSDRDELAIHHKTPPPVPIFATVHHQHLNHGSSSGFSEEGESPNESPQHRIHDQDQNEQPLSLVVPKKNYDSGHDSEEASRSPNLQSIDQAKEVIKIKDFAKFGGIEDAREKIPKTTEHNLLAALTAPPKKFPTLQLNPPAPVVAPPMTPSAASEVVIEDNMSEVSSIDSMSDLIQPQRIGDHTVYPCEFCDKVFGNKYHLASHLVTHTGERSFDCKFCQKTFGRRSTLRAHMTTHTKTSNFMCPLCEKACNDNNSLEEHIRMHTGEKPFVCTICAKAYARKSHLNVHYRVHTGERPFVCMTCGKDFTEKRFLNDHMQTAHSGNDGPLKCPNCFREFAYKTSLKQHLKKQMCAKNLNRGQPGSNISHHQGVHTKQFACPFCEKSYSWKQTLKQHVSMYHRNKVHTDEFWKYELAKHRRTVLDSKTNEDMWKKQLGKHASEEEIAANAAAAEMIHRSRSLEVHDRKAMTDQSDRWLEQIKRSTSSDPNQNSQVSAEMKLLALQSLQNSLQMISMKLPPPPPPSVTPTAPAVQLPKEESQPRPVSPAVSKVTQPPQNQQGYLTLLAHLSAQRKAEEAPVAPIAPIAAAPRVLRQASDSCILNLSEMKEESAVKRTQLWLAQLGHYKKNSFQDEMDRNHDELWEEQIAKAKSQPIKSPLEKQPTEITIAEELNKEQSAEEEIRGNCSAAPIENSPVEIKRPPTPLSPLKNVISIKTSAIQRVENSRTFSLALEVNNNEDSMEIRHPHIPVPLLPNRNSVQILAPKKKPLLEIPEDDHDHLGLIEKPVEETIQPPQKPLEQEESSVLKNLLKGRLPRKRPISPIPPRGTEVLAKRPSLDSSDILRRRLMGFKEVPEQVHPAPAPATPFVTPKFQPPSATITSQQLSIQGDYEDQSSPVDLRNNLKSSSELEEEVQQQTSSEKTEVPKNYTQTSVLKHLLYRYTNSDNNSSQQQQL